MKTFVPWLGVALTLLGTGCLPKERFWWSPDGSRAAVVLPDGLHLLTPGGKPAEPLVAATAPGRHLPVGVSWMKDGSGLVMLRTLGFRTWNEARDRIPADEAGEVERLALGVPGWVEALMATRTTAGTVEELVEGSPLLTEGPPATAFLCAYERKKQLIDAMLKRSAAGQALIKELEEREHEHVVYEVSLLRLEGGRLAGEPRPLLRSLRPVLMAEVSALGPVAFLRRMTPEEEPRLEVLPIEGGEPMLIANQVGGHFCWTADGRSLIYTSSFSGKENLFRQVHRCPVLDESGKWIADPEKRRMQDLAVAAMPEPARVVALPDGGVLFAALPVTFPAAGSGPEPAPRLYRIDANGNDLKVIPTAPDTLPADLGYFVLSPDGESLAVVERGTDAVAVVALRSGEVKIVSPVHPRWQCRTLPAWKSATELTFAALGEDGRHPGWKMWTPSGGVKSLGAGWPAKLTEDWLEERTESSPGAAPVDGSKSP